MSLGITTVRNAYCSESTAWHLRAMLPWALAQSLGSSVSFGQPPLSRQCGGGGGGRFAHLAGLGLRLAISLQMQSA